MNGKLFFVVQYCLTAQLQRIFNCGAIQNTILTPDKVLNMLIYKSPFCMKIYTSYKLLKIVCFRPTLYVCFQFTVPTAIHLQKCEC